ncbi:MAG: hypothetical protein ACO3EZ_18120 [Prochlorotrichaceae cyanobacterium]
MTQVPSTDLTVAALQESVRHNEKNIDKLDRDLRDFRSEVLKQFEKINDRFNQITMLLVAIVGLVVALLVKLVVFT